MEWFARHTAWLYRETKELSSNSIYREQYQVIGLTLISSGHIIVHKSRTEYFPILIVYPEATPYIPPTIYTLEHEISEETATEYSELAPEEIRQRVKDNIRFFKRRHQNEDGSICFIEMGDLHGENPEIFPIEAVIKRLRIWLSGRIPKDSLEVELFHHFPNRTYEVQYLLPDLFFDEEIVKGKFYAGLSSLIPANHLPDKIAKKTYMGVMIYGETRIGISLPPMTYVNEQLILFTPIPDIKRLILDKNSQEKATKIREGQLIEGCWWEISVEPEPFSSVSELARFIGNGDEGKGIDELAENFESELISLHELIYIGIRFPGRLRKTDWQMFRLNKGSRTPIVGAGKEELKLRLLDYSIQAVYQEYFTEDYFHMRNTGRAERGILKDTSISIIGCGALGSETADALAKAGVGKILLVDKEDLRAHNAIRHVLGINRTSIPKALGMAEHLVIHNPFVNIECNFSNILSARIDDYFPENTIGVSTIADDNVEAYLNEQAVDKGRTVFYCRALRGGKAARIFRAIPQTDACKACLGLHLKDKNPIFLNIPEDETLPSITNECNNPVRPASAADMKIIGGVFSRIIIDFLQGKNTENNHWIWSSEALDGLQLGNSTYGLIRADRIPPHPKCFVCHNLEDKKIHVLREVLDFMKQESADSGDVETGGVLVGYRNAGDEYIIVKASKPGPNAIRTKTRFEKDEGYCQKQLLDVFNELGEKGLYLGEWHYHPSGGNEPSGIDIKSLTEIAAQDNYRIDKPIMIILSRDLEYGITIHDKNMKCVRIPLNIIQDISDHLTNSST
jgi:integrative and conjugative element protein (TIGR02256 family)